MEVFTNQTNAQAPASLDEGNMFLGRLQKATDSGFAEKDFVKSSGEVDIKMAIDYGIK